MNAPLKNALWNENPRPLKVAICAGELSGDQHAARLLDALKQLDLSRITGNQANSVFSGVECKGMGGKALESSGMHLSLDFRIHGGLNGFNIPLILYKSFGALTRLFLLLRSWRPDVLVLVDYPDFNLRLAKLSRLLGIPTVYFIPPKVWAWRKKRVVTLRRWVDCLVGIFPFEKNFYEKAGHSDFRYVGHPFASIYTDNRELNPASFKATRAELCKTLGLEVDKPIIAVLPGSRTGEILRHLLPMAAGLKLLIEKLPGLQVVVPVAPSINKELLLSSLGAQTSGTEKWLTITTEPSINVMRAADVGLLKSGTCNLEAAFLGLPFVCCYKVSPIAAVLLRRILKISEFSLVNIIRSGTTKELMQEDANPENFAAELLKLLTDAEYVEQQKRGLSEVVAMLQSHDNHPLYLGTSTACERAALAITEIAIKRKNG
jgi:lipid-A-disaccharide synthase